MHDEGVPNGGEDVLLVLDVLHLLQSDHVRQPQDLERPVPTLAGRLTLALLALLLVWGRRGGRRGHRPAGASLATQAHATERPST